MSKSFKDLNLLKNDFTYFLIKKIKFQATIFYYNLSLNATLITHSMMKKTMSAISPNTFILSILFPNFLVVKSHNLTVVSLDLHLPNIINCRRPRKRCYFL